MKKVRGQNGGARPGAGRKRGGKNQSTLTKEAQKDRLRQRVYAEFDPLIDAQIAHAKGVCYMVLRRPDGTFSRATDAKQIDAAIAAGGTTFQIYTQAPNVQAFTYLVDQAIDKPAQHVEMTGKDDGPVEFKWRS